MSVIKGCAGEVHVQAADGSWVAVGETQSWQMSESCTVLKRQTLARGCRRILGSKDQAWVLSAAGYLDMSNPGQQLLANGQKRRFRVYVSTHRDNYFYEGLALIHTHTRSGAAKDQLARWVIAATGMGYLDAPGLVPLRVRAYANGAHIYYPNGAVLGAYQH